jgi:hypothetical protein
LSRRIHIILDMAAIMFYAGAIFFMSSFAWPSSPGGLFPGADLFAHALLYAGLGLLVCRFLANGLRRSAPAAMIVAAALTSLYGLSDEIHQAFVPGRVPAGADFAANTAGAILAVVVWYFLMRPKRKPALLLMAEPPADTGYSNHADTEDTEITQSENNEK